MSEPWDKKLSIVIFPEGSLRDKVVSELNAWLEARLISPCIWIFPEQIDFSVQPPILRGHVSGLDLEGFVDNREVTITDVLAAQEYSLVRVISLISAGDALELSEDLKILHSKVSEAIRASLPLDPTEEVHESERRHARVLRVNLVMVPTQATDNIKELFAGASTADHVNVIVSGEDRATPWTADSYVRNDEKLPRFIASHLSSIGGVWNGLDIGVLDDLSTFKKGNYYVTRLFVNSIMTDGLARRIAAEVLADVANPDSPSHQSWNRTLGGTVVVDSELDQYVRMMVEATLSAEGNALRFNQASAVAHREQEGFKIGSELIALFKFAATMFLNIPREIVTAAKHRFGKELSEALHGDSGMQKYKAVEDDFSSLDSNFQRTLNEISELKAKAQNEIATPPSSLSEIPKVPRLWSQIRSLVFGVLDGSDYSDILPEKRFVFSRVKDVIQDPNAEIELSDIAVSLTDIEKLAWDNIEDTPKVLNALSEEIKNVEQRIDQDKARQVQIRVYLDWHENNPVAQPQASNLNEQDLADNNVGEVPVAEDQAQPAPVVQAPTPEELAHHRADLENLEALIPELQQRLVELARERERLESWQKTSQNSYVWKLLEAVQGELQKAHNELKSYEQILESETYPSAEELSTSKKQYRKNLFRLLGVWTSSLLVAILALFSTNPIGMQIAIIVLILLSMGPSTIKTMQSPKRVLGIFLMLLVIGLVATVLGLGPLFATFMAWLGSLWLGWIVISLIFSIFFGFLGSCASYSRSWSQFRRKVYQKTTDLGNIVQGVDKTRTEIKRLNALYAQLKEFALLLGAVISQPWKVDPLWHQSQGLNHSDQQYPFSLHIAQPLENESDAIKRIRSEAREALMTKGWRYEVYKLIIASFAKRQPAANRDLFTVEEVESDVAHGTGSIKDLVLKEIVDNDDLLYEIARIKMRELRIKIQDEFLVENPPRVLEVRKKPLSEMHVDLIEYEEDLGVEWDNFLTQTISSDIPNTPMSVDRFHSDARVEAIHRNVKSIVIAPSRLNRNLQYAVMKTYERQKSLPQEAVLRLDYVDVLGEELNTTKVAEANLAVVVDSNEDDGA